MNTEIVPVDSIDLAPRMVMTPQEALVQLTQFKAFVNAVMVDGQDFGKIPGVEKPTLLKPGAEKLCEIYALTPDVEVVNRIEDWESGFFHYECRCKLISRRNGMVYAVGVGSCNSREKRYADRWVFGNEIPAGVDRDGLQKREFNGKNGKFVKYLWKNEDIYTLVNTILKMSKKRALIDATLSATRSSGMFTQDVEDWIEAEARPSTSATRVTQPRQAVTKTPPPTDEPPIEGYAEEIAEFQHAQDEARLSIEKREALLKRIRTDAAMAGIYEDKLNDYAVKLGCVDFEHASEKVLDKIANRIADLLAKKEAK